MLAKVRRNDRIVTTGGLMGIVSKVVEDDDLLVVEIAEGVKVNIRRSMLADVVSKTGTIPPPPKSDKAKSKSKPKKKKDEAENEDPKDDDQGDAHDDAHDGARDDARDDASDGDQGEVSDQDTPANKN